MTSLSQTSKKPKIPPTFLHKVANDKNTSEIYKIKDISKVLIIIEPRRRKNNSAKEMVLNNWSHKKKINYLQLRCVKCNKNQLYINCDKDINP